MPYLPFHNICPSTAEKETRVITLQQNDNEFHLPQGDYVFIELFCDECDCRRVFLQVFMNQKIVATIAYGWEKLSFYKKAFKGFNEKDIKEVKGPTLDSFLYQSDTSDRVLKMFYKILFSDKVYLDRIEKHYDQFKKALKTISD
ncbi:MAG: hypothetical protein GZ094_05200 [Mariniphaga sp.]|nr:hypothetical protein [Mariniphaga sp.]